MSDTEEDNARARALRRCILCNVVGNHVSDKIDPADAVMLVKIAVEAGMVTLPTGYGEDGTFEGGWNLEALDDLWNAYNSHGRITDFDVWPIGANPTIMTMPSDIARLEKLTRLCINVPCQAVPSEFSNLKNLEEFVFTFSTDNLSVLHPLNLNSLKKFSLLIRGNGDSRISVWLGKSSLLSLTEFCLQADLESDSSSEGVPSILEGLHQSTLRNQTGRPKKLELMASFDPLKFETLFFHVLPRTMPDLESLRVMTPYGGQLKDGISIIAERLERKGSLGREAIHLLRRINLFVMHSVAELWDYRGNRNREGLLPMLKHCPCLDEVDLERDEAQGETKFVMSINRYGRFLLESEVSNNTSASLNISLSLWPRVLANPCIGDAIGKDEKIRIIDDNGSKEGHKEGMGKDSIRASCVFYLLRKGPLLGQLPERRGGSRAGSNKNVTKKRDATMPQHKTVSKCVRRE